VSGARRTSLARAALGAALVAVGAAALGTAAGARPARGEAGRPGVAAPAPVTVDSPPDGGAALAVDTGRSAVRWRGTKFRGRGTHEGTVRLAGGSLALCGGRVCGGRFVLDMRSIAVTDIPAHEPVPRAQLTRHLNGPDFFWTDRHPTATFVLREATRRPDGRYEVAGALTLRGRTQPLAFPATLREEAGGARRVDARLRIDRQRWGVAYRWDPIRNELVDDEIQLELELVFPAAPTP
jgi:polyisoprenoid-binding protein YceI